MPTRTYVKTKPSAKSAAKAEPKAAEEPVKAEEAVIEAPEEQMMKQIVYEPSSQILTRDVKPNESFGVGDDMPIYYL